MFFNIYYLSLLLFICSLLFSIFLNFLLINFAKKLKKDKLKINQERWTNEHTPTLGGTAFFIIFLLAIIFLNYYSIYKGFQINLKEIIFVIFGASLSYLLGLFDDVFYLNPIIKFLIQLIISVIMIIGGIYINVFDNIWINYLLTVLWIIGIMNATNLLDNMDGTAAISVIGIAGTILSICLLNNINTINVASLFIIIGILVGFLIFNWPKAKIYMGDSGSQFLGFIIAMWGIKYIWNLDSLLPNTTYHWIVPFILIAVIYCLPLLDTSITFLKRILYHRSPLLGGKDHTTHHLVYLGFTNTQVLLLMIFISMLNFLISYYFINNINQLNSFFYLGIFTYLIIIFAFLLYASFTHIEKSYHNEKNKKITDL
ncbi:MAG: UDP-GlcNAc:undecaprenyl-phosphate/decaprenyl-phosphate GlcNAc-phosphate transferase [Rikenellaceae bacterium]|nr:UDP-GlcNAc:undecaprenyl-phosphate/decaprenyl-phosphate GlcNAc-phosphate transferase [Rikenellaceae bacterium]